MKPAHRDISLPAITKLQRGIYQVFYIICDKAATSASDGLRQAAHQSKNHRYIMRRQTPPRVFCGAHNSKIDTVRYDIANPPILRNPKARQAFEWPDDIPSNDRPSAYVAPRREGFQLIGFSRLQGHRLFNEHIFSSEQGGCG